MLSHRVTLAFLLVLSPVVVSQLYAAPPQSPLGALYWCPDRASEARLQMQPASDCALLIEKKDSEKSRRGDGPIQAVVTGDLDREVQKFSKRYNQTLSQIPSSGSDVVPDLEELEDQATALLERIQAGVAATWVQSSTVMMKGAITSLADARHRVRTLRKELVRLDKSKQELDDLDYEAKGNARVRLRQTEEKIERDSVPVPERPRALTGEAITHVPLTDPTYGTGTVRVGPSVGIAPPTLGELADTPPSRPRDSSLTTTKPVSSAPVGKDVGNSPFNERSPIGSDIGNSRFNSMATTGTDIGAAQGPSGPSSTPAKTGADIGNSSSNQPR